MDFLPERAKAVEDSQIAEALLNTVTDHPVATIAVAAGAAAVLIPACRAIGSRLLGGRASAALIAREIPVAATMGTDELFLFSAQTARPAEQIAAAAAAGDFTVVNGVPMLPPVALCADAHVTMKAGANSWMTRTYNQCADSVVHISGSHGAQGGSGFFVGEGLVATNHHVAAGLGNGAKAVTLADGRGVAAELLSYDRNADLALLKIVGADTTQFAPLQLGYATRMPSLKSAAIGFPGSRDIPVLSPGSLTSLTYGNDAKLTLRMKTYFGSSGSPVLDAQGRVIGILKEGTLDISEPPVSQAVNVEHLRALLASTARADITQGALSVSTAIRNGNVGKFAASEVKLNLSRGLQLEQDYAIQATHMSIDAAPEIRSLSTRYQMAAKQAAPFEDAVAGADTITDARWLTLHGEGYQLKLANSMDGNPIIKVVSGSKDLGGGQLNIGGLHWMTGLKGMVLPSEELAAPSMLRSTAWQNLKGGEYTAAVTQLSNKGPLVVITDSAGEVGRARLDLVTSKWKFSALELPPL